MDLKLKALLIVSLLGTVISMFLMPIIESYVVLGVFAVPATFGVTYAIYELWAKKALNAER